MKKFHLVLILMLFISILTACGTSSDEENASSGQEEESSNLYEEIQEKGVITVGTEGTYPPFSFHNDKDELTGYDVEVMCEVASRLGLEVEFNETQWDSMFAGLNAERFDVIANQVGINDERLEKYNFSDPYTYTGAVLVVPSSNEEITAFEDLEGKKSAQSLTSNFKEIATEYGAEVVGVEGMAQAVENIKLGRVDVTVNDKLAVLQYMNETNNEDVKIAAELDDVSETAFTFRKGNEELVNAFNDELAEMKEDGTLAEISKEWFGEDVSVK
ncbi:amino acid ABC transporter substrate-binding protein [Gracilibacillus salinarum]|uniref:Amino acid ABC transporter substrate-binding protein n=1 Tax=Gracilibacillus salinarum TaxID=2932255 RepID=A0ABY4GSU5_9BACI|nr:amino acid ABC transporter substrate-binding protein [Gracilibacillus salinarum]UOQ87299.1 amino acid ABC transporter substrate-binding protein [Gracilibacillus salinarum]